MTGYLSKKDMAQDKLAQPAQEPKSVTYKEVQDSMNALEKGDLRQQVIAEELGQRKLYTSPPQRTEQEPVDLEIMASAVHDAYLNTCDALGWGVKPENRVPYYELTENSKELDRASVRAVLRLVVPPPQPAQEPAAWMKASDTEWSMSFFEEDGYVPLYTTPPQREPLTESQIIKIINAHTHDDSGHDDIWVDGEAIARAIEAAHGIKEKNNG